MSCFNVGDHNILLCEREHPIEKADVADYRTHHSFTVSPETFTLACKVFQERHIPIADVVYRTKGFFTGRELYFFDPSGNKLELRDPTWQQGMPEPSLEEIIQSYVQSQSNH